MITETIDKAFCKMIGQSGAHKILGITPGHVKVLRNHMRNGVKISIDKKLHLLHKSGWDLTSHKWSDQDMITLVQFVLKQSAAARDLGPGYLFDKFKNRQG